MTAEEKLERLREIVKRQKEKIEAVENSNKKSLIDEDHARREALLEIYAEILK
jgi:hypothetical protein